MIETSSVAPRKSSATLGNLQKMFEKCSETFVKPSEQFWRIFGKWSEIFGKSSKTSLLVCLYNKQNITCPLVDMNFIFECSTRYLTSERSALVRYRVEHSKIKFISTRRHVIFSIYTGDIVISRIVVLGFHCRSVVKLVADVICPSLVITKGLNRI